MQPAEFEKCKQIDRYDDFMAVALNFDGLTMEDYKEFMPTIFEIVPSIKDRDPVIMYEKVISELRSKWSASENLPFHGPWHHGLVAGILISALRNNGYSFDADDVKETLKRGPMMPPGSCGFIGICGAGAGLGIALSIAEKSTPFHDEERAKAMKVSKEVLERLSRLGGPRCCRMSTYTTLHMAGHILRDLGYEIPVSSVGGRCADHELNPECHGERCPYFPRQ